jgi:hypothetical protein
VTPGGFPQTGISLLSPGTATVANIRNQMRNSAQYIWAGPDDATTWCVDNKVNLDEAPVWANRSIQMEEQISRPRPGF